MIKTSRPGTRNSCMYCPEIISIEKGTVKRKLTNNPVLYVEENIKDGKIEKGYLCQAHKDALRPDIPVEGVES